MGMIKGITVQLIERVDTGTRDSMNHPVYKDADPVDVENVLVAPTTAADVIDSTYLEGKSEIYTLAIPKGDKHNWKDAKVVFFGNTYHQFGGIAQGIESLIPLDWNKKVTVERYE